MVDQFDFVFLIQDDNHWEKLFSHIVNLKQQSVVNNIAVVILNTAILSCLESTHLDAIKVTFSKLTNENIEFYLCTNTLFRYGMEENMLLPEIKIAKEGGLLKVALFETLGYHKVTL